MPQTTIDRTESAAFQVPVCHDFVVIAGTPDGAVLESPMAQYRLELPYESADRVDPLAYHGPLIALFERRRQLPELAESNFEPDDLASP